MTSFTLLSHCRCELYIRVLDVGTHNFSFISLIRRGYSNDLVQTCVWSLMSWFLLWIFVALHWSCMTGPGRRSLMSCHHNSSHDSTMHRASGGAWFGEEVHVGKTLGCSVRFTSHSLWLFNAFSFKDLWWFARTGVSFSPQNMTLCSKRTIVRKPNIVKPLI